MLQKAAILALFGLSSLVHVQPWACRGNLLLFPELFNVSLSIFALRNYTSNINAGLFENDGYILLSHLKLRDTRGQIFHSYYLPYVRTSIRKNSVVHGSIIVWNALHACDFKEC